MSSSIVSPAVIYPESDGKPMGETDVHVHEIAELYIIFKDRYRNDPNVFAGANMLCYYEEGVPSSCFCPDVFIVFGVPNKTRRTFKFWEERKPPGVIFEVSSRKTRREDLVGKKELYASLGVREYFIYDPLHEYLRPPLQGFKLKSGEYISLPSKSDGSLTSQLLGLNIKLEKGALVLTDSSTGELQLRPLEEKQLRREEEQLRREEARLRHEAEAEVQRLRAELEKLKKKNGHK